MLQVVGQVVARWIPRRASRISRPRPLDHHLVRSLLTTSMVQTRRAAQRAATGKDEPKYDSTVDVKPKEEYTSPRRSPKRASTSRNVPERES